MVFDYKMQKWKMRDQLERWKHRAEKCKAMYKLVQYVKVQIFKTYIFPEIKEEKKSHDNLLEHQNCNIDSTLASPRSAPSCMPCSIHTLHTWYISIGHKKLSIKTMLLPVRIHLYELQGDHSPDNVKFPDISLTVRSTPPLHSACSVLFISCLY